MILSVGEILADILIEGDSVSMCVGGAPFNLAVNAGRAGAKVAFIGRVGDDPVGKYILARAKRAPIDLRIEEDGERRTALAFVSLKDGERDFAFFRQNAADSHIGDVELSGLKGTDILHLGSLMLSEPHGIALVDGMIKKARMAGVRISFDVNLRLDVFKDREAVLSAYDRILSEADILKFSEDELLYFAGSDDLDLAMDRYDRDGRLLIVTLGARGSMFSFGGQRGEVPADKVEPIDTTGAGDAFFGTALALIDCEERLDTDKLRAILRKANLAGAEATKFRGAIRL